MPSANPHIISYAQGNYTLSDYFDRNAVIAALYNSPEINEAISKMQPEQLQADLKQEMFAALCSMNADKFKRIYLRGYLKYYLLRMMITMAKSDRSSFYITYRRFNEEYINAMFYILPDGTINALHRKAWYWDDSDKAYTDERVTPTPITCIAPEPDTWIECVNDAVAGLGDNDARLFRMYAQKQSRHTIADEINRTERTVRWQIARCRQKLKKALRRAA